MYDLEWWLVHVLPHIPAILTALATLIVSVRNANRIGHVGRKVNEIHYQTNGIQQQKMAELSVSIEELKKIIVAEMRKSNEKGPKEFC